MTVSKKRINDICAGVSPEMTEAARELAANVLFMADKLAEMREALEDEPLTVEYNHGGGQSGIRKNPAFDAYNSLMRTYNSSINQLTAVLGATGKAVPAKGRLLKFDSDKFAKVKRA